MLAMGDLFQEVSLYDVTRKNMFCLIYLDRYTLINSMVANVFNV